MALVPDQKFSTFQNGGDLVVGDIIVGLRDGLNTRFNYTGELPPSVVVPIVNGGTGATTATQARINLGLGTIAVQDANAVAITGGSAALGSGSVVAAPSAGIDIANKTYVDSAVAGSVTSITGTANQVLANGTSGSAQTGAITLTLPQSIATSSSPTFAGLTLSSPLTVANGGTGLATLNTYRILAAGTTATGVLQQVSAGSSGQLLQSNGASALPSWTTATFPAGSGTLNHLLRSDGTNWVETTATTLDASDNLAGLTSAAIGNLSLSANSLISSNSNGNISFIPNGIGSVLVGSTTPFISNGSGLINFLVAKNSCQGSLGAATYTNDAFGSSIISAKSRSTSIGSFTAVQSGDVLCNLNFAGDDGSQLLVAAQIRPRVSGAVSAGIVPSLLELRTTNTSGTLTTAVSISNAQVVTLTNPLLVSSGGTGLATLSTYRLLAGGTTATGNLQQVSAGTSGQLLQSNGAGVLPSWTTATFPSGSGTLNHMLRSDGTNWVETTSTVLTSGDAMSGLTSLTSGNLNLTANILSSTNANGNINIIPNGTGAVGLGQGNYTTGSIIPIQLTSTASFTGVGNTAIGLWTNNANGPGIAFIKSRSTSVGASGQTIVQTGDEVMRLGVYASNGSGTFTECAQILATVNGTVSGTTIPTQILFKTMTTGGSLSTALTISNAQVSTFTGQVIAPSFSPNTTSGIIGTTTNDSAAAGSVGELLSGTNATGVAMTTGVVTQINTLPLPAGDWDVWAVFYTTPGASTTQGPVLAALNPATATISSPSTAQLTSINTTNGGSSTGQPLYLNTGISRWSLSGTTTVYLNAAVNYAVSTLTGNGNIYARRRR